ncbi:hypothetical protein, partial [Enterococcus faecium]|uniref:hypothetical protein n=1 Tax=Enterococcus faecium TaxID=1352 RepID=UPI003DA116A2
KTTQDVSLEADVVVSIDNKMDQLRKLDEVKKVSFQNENMANAVLSLEIDPNTGQIIPLPLAEVQTPGKYPTAFVETMANITAKNMQ